MNVRDKYITVLGAGRSGVSAAILLAKQKANVLISDSNAANESSNLVNIFNEHHINFEFGHHSDKILKSDFVILSPGIPCSSAIVQKLKERDIPVYSEIELASWFAKSPIIAVTGSNGKTTTTSLIEDMLVKSGISAIACGNIGRPFSEVVYSAISHDSHPLYITEISSFQLETTQSFHPNVAVILNITPDHLDRYDSFLDYALTKCRILLNQDEHDYAVLNRDNKVINKIAKTNAHVIPVSKEKLPDSIAYFNDKTFSFKVKGTWHEMIKNDIKLFGIHNEYNIASAVSAISSFIDKPDGIFKSLREFKGIAHRIEFAGEISNIRFYNDSKGTNIDAVKMALQSFKNPLHLILGGQDKDSDFTELADYISPKDRIYLIGDASMKIKTQLNNFPLIECGKLETAVFTAYENAQPGDAILLSPACTSYDQYNNYEERGDHFKKLVKSIMDKGNENK